MVSTRSPLRTETTLPGRQPLRHTTTQSREQIVNPWIRKAKLLLSTDRPGGSHRLPSHMGLGLRTGGIVTNLSHNHNMETRRANARPRMCTVRAGARESAPCRGLRWQKDARGCPRAKVRRQALPLVELPISTTREDSPRQGSGTRTCHAPGRG